MSQCFWQWLVAHGITPKDRIQHAWVRFVLMAKVHSAGLFRAGCLWRVHLIDHAVVPVLIIRVEGRLVTRAIKERRDQRCHCIVVVHWWNAQQILHAADHAHRRIEGIVNKGLRAVWRKLAHNQRDAAMCVDMVGSILRVVFENEEGGIIPVGTMRDRLHHTPTARSLSATEARGLGIPMRVPAV